MSIKVDKFVSYAISIIKPIQTGLAYVCLKQVSSTELNDSAKNFRKPGSDVDSLGFSSRSQVNWKRPDAEI
jgi:hypothetical protein